MGIALLMAINFFLPFASANSSYRKSLMEFSDIIKIDELDMTCGDIVDLSMFEYMRIYGDTAFGGEGGSQEVAILCFIVIALLALFTVLSLL